MGTKIIAENKKARFDYHIIETFEAGMVLLGSELKPIRSGAVQLKDSYVEILSDELFLLNAHISSYKASSYNNHEPERKRKLLMSRAEIKRLHSKVKEKGYSIVPLKMYFKNGFVKIEIAFVKGKKAFDKRETIKKRDVNREISKSLKKTR